MRYAHLFLITDTNMKLDDISFKECQFWMAHWIMNKYWFLTRAWVLAYLVSRCFFFVFFSRRVHTDPNVPEFSSSIHLILCCTPCTDRCLTFLEKNSPRILRPSWILKNKKHYFLCYCNLCLIKKRGRVPLSTKQLFFKIIMVCVKPISASFANQQTTFNAKTKCARKSLYQAPRHAV